MPGLPLQKPNVHELKSWLFEQFLLKEKPELAQKNRKKLFEDLNMISAEEAKVKLEEYGKTLTELAAKFPQFLKESVKDLEKMMKDIQKQSGEFDKDDLQKLEGEISSLGDS